MSRHVTITPQPLTIRNLNPRAEIHGEDQKVGALDVDCEIVVEDGAGILQQLGFLWGKKLWKENEVADTGLAKRFGLGIRLETYGVTIEIDGIGKLEVTDATVGKFTAKPLLGKQLELRFQIQLHPRPQDIAFLWVAAFEAGPETMSIQVLPPQADFIKEAATG